MKVLKSHSIISVISGKKILMDNNEIRVVLFDEKVLGLLVKAFCSPGCSPASKRGSTSAFCRSQNIFIDM